jgi:AcrR family transcriptional regulator
MACFTRRGFQRTSKEDIIGEAKLSAGAIYSYFQSKDQIIETLADERRNREKQLIRQAVKSGTGINRLICCSDIFMSLSLIQRSARNVGREFIYGPRRYATLRCFG